MKRLLNEWKKFLNESLEIDVYGNEEFEKRFVDYFSRSIQDRDFLAKISDSGFDMKDHPKRGQLESGMTHTWFTSFGKPGAQFVVDEKVDRYLRDLPDSHKQYLLKFFGKIFGELNSHKMRRTDVKFKRHVAYLGRHQLLDWWIADDGIELFYWALKRKLEGK